MTAIDRLNQIEAIANAATEGPWSWACRTSADGDHWAVYKGDTAHALASNRDGWGPDAEFIAAARTDVPWLIGQVRFLLGELAAAVADNEKKDAALRAVLDLHRPFTIWDECDCTPEQKDDEHTHTEVDEVGRTCNRLYIVCKECCTGPYGQMEHCADGHDHTLNPVDRCPTVRAIEEALS